jgi:hypothetical protein
MAGIYIHIPYCKKKCSYCNFISIASLKSIDDYVNNLLLEIKMQAVENFETSLQEENLKFDYFVGENNIIEEAMNNFANLNKVVGIKYVLLPNRENLVIVSFKQGKK